MMESAKGEKVRHAMGALLVDILTPVAAVIKYETSMPAVKKLVQTLYSHFYDQTKRTRHSTVSSMGMSFSMGLRPTTRYCLCSSPVVA